MINKHDWLQAHDGRLARIVGGPYVAKGLLPVIHYIAVDENGQEMRWYATSGVWKHVGPSKPAFDLDALTSDEAAALGLDGGA